ncbi:MAG: type IV toxin-antitoxin system AbiEi family antitoxin domain-containing protein [Planctomycetes bacterium]|nr:type IV toxin-antitoxin system AbiEi family antitoxin domain-containing protein [Planctomycetota bacterium]
MEFEELLKRTANLSCFTTRFMVAGQNLAQVRLQLNRWVKDGRLIRLHKGLYILAEPYRKVKPEAFTIANRLKLPSYVSLQSALAWYGMIPEFVPVVTSVTVGRPERLETPLGRFEYRHISQKFFWGYYKAELSAKQQAFVARPEKALLDWIYLTAGGDRREFIDEIRLQNFSRLNKDVLDEYAKKSKSHKLERAVSNIKRIIDELQGVEL